MASDLAQILVLRRIIEEVKSNNLTAVFCSIDFQEAFDFVRTGKMMKILEAHDVPPNLLQVNETMYMGMRAKVKMSDGISKEFHI